jgi:hypothetical protein
MHALVRFMQAEKNEQEKKAEHSIYADNLLNEPLD